MSTPTGCGSRIVTSSQAAGLRRRFRSRSVPRAAPPGCAAGRVNAGRDLRRLYPPDSAEEARLAGEVVRASPAARAPLGPDDVGLPVRFGRQPPLGARPTEELGDQPCLRGDVDAQIAS